MKIDDLTSKFQLLANENSALHMKFDSVPENIQEKL